VPSGREVLLTSGAQKCDFVVPNMNNLFGTTRLVGSAGNSNYLSVELHPQAGSSMDVTASTRHLSLKNADGTMRQLQHVNVNFRNYLVFSEAGQTSRFTLLPPEDFDIIRVTSTGVAGSNLIHDVTGCDARGEVVLRLTGAGKNTINFGNIQGLQKSQCTVQVIGSSDKGQENHVVVNATADSRKLRWQFNHGGFVVTSSNTAHNTQPFLVFFEGVKRVTVHFSTEANDVVINAGTLGTEYEFKFPTVEAPVSSVRVVRTTDAMVVTGSLSQLSVGPSAPTSTQEPGQAPFNGIQGVIAYAGAARIVLDSAHGPLAPPQRFTMDSVCLNAEGAQPTLPTPWMAEKIAAVGLPTTRACGLLIKSGVGASVTVITGGASDSFIADGAAVPVTADMGDGADKFQWLHSADVTAKVNLGVGADTLMVGWSGRFDVDLGDDKFIDEVTVLYDKVSPSIVDTTVSPIGSFADSVLTVTHWYPEDTVSIKRRA